MQWAELAFFKILLLAKKVEWWLEFFFRMRVVKYFVLYLFGNSDDLPKLSFEAIQLRILNEILVFESKRVEFILDILVYYWLMGNSWIGSVQGRNQILNAKLIDIILIDPN